MTEPALGLGFNLPTKTWRGRASILGVGRMRGRRYPPMRDRLPGGH
jgi:hypothetical protein